MLLEEHVLHPMMVAAQSGGAMEMEWLLEYVRPGLQGYLRGRLSEAVRAYQDEEDIVQETLLRISLGISSWDPANPAVPWVLRISRNEGCIASRDARRLKRWPGKRPLSLDPGGDGDDGARIDPGDQHPRPCLLEWQEATKMLEDFKDCIQRLPETLRGAYALTFKGASRSEAAAALKCTPTAITLRLHRGRKQLARCMKTKGWADA